MEKEFVPYDIALAMKELGFDEPCLFRYTAQKDLTNGGCYDNSSPSDAMLTADEIHESHILAPLYQQAFRWFREKLKESAIEPYDMVKNYSYNMKVSWEEAQDACLKKLIETVNKNTKQR